MSSSEEVPLSTTENNCAALGARGGAMDGTRASAGSAKIARRKGIIVAGEDSLFTSTTTSGARELSPGQVSELARVFHDCGCTARARECAFLHHCKLDAPPPLAWRRLVQIELTHLRIL